MKTRYPHDQAMVVALALEARLAPFCECIQIVGSLRRHRAEVGDIELLYVPRFDERQSDLFTTAPVNVADEELGRWLMDGTLQKRPNVNGHTAWGDKNKLGVHVPSGIPVDLFATTPGSWWVSLVIRTWGKETNLRLTTSAQRLGRKLNAYGAGITRWDMCGEGPREVIIPATSERHVFELCGVKYEEPQNRR